MTVLERIPVDYHTLKESWSEKKVDGNMGKWLSYTVELRYGDQWFNIDQWYRSANGGLRHAYLYAAPERDIFSSPYDELAFIQERISFSDLAEETQEIIRAENPEFERSSFDSWNFFIWGSLSDFEKLLQKPVENENDEYIHKELLKKLTEKIQEQVKAFQQTIPYEKAAFPPETQVRIIICEI
ncbi:MAG: hypothetical protein ACOX85_10640 [Candidatus Pararuminococcus gallinarum]